MHGFWVFFFVSFWTIYCCLEPLPLTYALHHAYPNFIYVLACSMHIHTSIRDHLRWLGSSLVHLGGFEVQSKPAACMHPICFQRLTILSYCNIKHVPDILTCWAVIINSVIGSILMC